MTSFEEKRTYQFDPSPFSTHTLLIDCIPQNSRVLEVGTASGYMGGYLIKEKKCEVWGVEPVAQLYTDASQKGYAVLWQETVETFLLNHKKDAGQFDVILLADVLEHMVNPDNVLKELHTFLNPNGILLISLPNIAHYSIRTSLLRGRFDMTDAGILDRTHLKFFTKKTAIELFERAGYRVDMARPCSGSQERRWPRLGYPLAFFIHRFPELFAIQFIYIARQKT